MQIFLGGTAGSSTWRKEIAIPLLEKAGVGYFNPQLGVGEWTPAHQQKEAAAKQTAEVWLFVITAESRGVASMVEAAYRIGNGGKISLVIQAIEEDTIIDGVPIEESERKDLNRGRSYLEEVATLNGVPVFKQVDAATNYALHLLNE